MIRHLHRFLHHQSLFKFVYLAHFRPGKNHVWLVRAIASALRKHPEARLILCGQDLYGVGRRVKKLINEKSLEKQIIMPGFISREKIPILLNHINCAIVASRAETFGYSYIEPMFFGVPVVGTPIGVGKDVVINGKTGILINLKNSKSLKFAVEQILRDKNWAKEMGQKAKNLVTTRFTYNVVAQQLINMYIKLLGGSNAPNRKD